MCEEVTANLCCWRTALKMVSVDMTGGGGATYSENPSGLSCKV